MFITDLKQLEQFKGVPGIYRFYFIKNNKNYIGEAIDLWRRITIQYPKEIKRNVSRSVVQAIKKHGWENIQIELLDWGNHLKEANERLALETACIEAYNSLTVNQSGYNICFFGHNWQGGKHSEITKKQMSQNHYDVNGKNNPMFGKNHSDTAKSKISKANLGHKHTLFTKKLWSIQRSGNKNPNFGKPMTEHQKNKNRATWKRKMVEGYIAPTADLTLYIFKNKITNELFTGTRRDFYKKYHLQRAGVDRLIHNTRKSSQKWVLLGIATSEPLLTPLGGD